MPSSREWIIDRQVHEIIGKMVRGTATNADKERFDDLHHERIVLMIPRSSRELRRLVAGNDERAKAYYPGRFRSHRVDPSPR